MLAMTKGALELTEPDDVRIFNEDGAIVLAGISLTVRHAPGHTEGSVVFEVADANEPLMFSGDLLFAGSIGRSDLPGGDPIAMQRSLSKVVLSAPDEMVVLPGHGARTTIGAERATNPYLLDVQPPPTRGL